MPFLGGFIERVSPAMTQALDRDQRNRHGIADELFRHLTHYSNATAARHLFLLTNSCGGCLRNPCYRCATWQIPYRHFPGMALAATLGPSWPRDAIAPRAQPPTGRRWLTQLIIPRISWRRSSTTRIMCHCATRMMTAAAVTAAAAASVASASAPGVELVVAVTGDRIERAAAVARGAADPNTADKELLLFYQGALIQRDPRGHPRRAAYRGLRSECHAKQDGHTSFGGDRFVQLSAASQSEEQAARTPGQQRVARVPTTGNAIAPVTSSAASIAPLAWPSSIRARIGIRSRRSALERRSSGCNARASASAPGRRAIQQALLHGAARGLRARPLLVPFVRSEPSATGGSRARAQASETSIRFSLRLTTRSSGSCSTRDTEADIKGFIDKLREIPDAVVRAKQRAIERVRHLLLYDMSGSREDAFTCMLRQVIKHLSGLAHGSDERRVQLQLPDNRLPFGPDPRRVERL